MAASFGSSSELLQAVLLIPLLPFLLCPYFFVFYRRLPGLGLSSSRARTVTLLLIAAFIPMFPISGVLIDEIWLTVFLVIPYLAALLCKEPAQR